MSALAVKKQDVLSQLTFGQRVAEEEGEELAKYFVETEQWRRIYAGDVDMVYGPKGSGKCALYSLLLARAASLNERGIIVVPAENARGTLAFKGLVEDPPTSEREFIGLWKLYFLSLVGDILKPASSEAAKRVMGALGEAGLRRRNKNLRTVLRSVIDYVRSFHPQSIEAGVDVSPFTGLPVGVKGKITLREPRSQDARRGFVSVDSLFEAADDALGDLGSTVWILLDRLDVAFSETKELEENALRALFKVYLDLVRIGNVRLKVFLRSDIWRRITASGFREASHITRQITISWDDRSLLNLVLRRILQNEVVCKRYKVTTDDVLKKTAMQDKFFYRLFPDKVEIGKNKPWTFDWMLGRTRDGTGETAPRELIHLLNRTREVQLHSLELGGSEPDGELLFTAGALKEALPEVSRTRLEQTLFAEYPRLRKPLQKLDGEKTLQKPRTLARIWGISPHQAVRVANELVEVGFFQLRGSGQSPEYWVPFLYRDVLNMVQGTAE